MRKSKYLAIVISLALMLGMVACGQQAEQTPQEPEGQQSESVSMEPTMPPIETETQETQKPVESKEPVEVAENDPEEVVESASVEATPAPTPIPTEAPKQEPVVTKAPESATTATNMTATTDAVPQQSETVEPVESETVEIQSNSRENWDQAVYDSLTPEQKVVYENASASSRASFNARVKSIQQREAEGWTTDWGTSENFDDQWAQITVGQ